MKTKISTENIIKHLGITKKENLDIDKLNIDFSLKYMEKGILVTEELDLVVKDSLNMSIHSVKTKVESRNIFLISEDLFYKLVEKINSQKKIKLDVIENNETEESRLSETKVGELLYNILLSAKLKRASDIHIVPKSNGLEVKFRIDGALIKDKVYPKGYSSYVINKIKNESKLDIFNTQTPQDGKLQKNIEGSRMEFRVSTLPTIYGENAVMRVVNSSSVLTRDLTELGFHEEDLKNYREKFSEPYGMIINVGATGAGKTTTFYLTLNELVQKFPHKNICTVEDPVEIKFDKVLQVQVEEKQGLDFPVVLKSLLRQDPDIILVGEMRDQDTSEIAVRSALTGHMVLSTLHANDSFNSITRLRDLGISDTLLSSTLTCLLSQRLSRKLCDCKIKEEIPKHIIEKYNLDFNEYYVANPNGCAKCSNTGYAGRVAIIEVCVIDEDYKVAISEGRPEVEIKKIAKNKGFRNLWINGLEKVKNGTIGLIELESVVSPDKIINS